MREIGHTPIAHVCTTNSTEDYSMYTCVRCKNSFEGMPALENGAGKFCASCKNFIFDKMKRSVKERQDALRGMCLWCGGTISSDTAMSNKEDEHVCKKCAKGRDWLLRCIRFSDRPAHYVARVEEKESVIRIAREAELVKAKENGDKMIDALPSEMEFRVKRMEDLLTKLANELGVF